MSRAKLTSRARLGRARFPPLPPSFRGRTNELATLTALVRRQHPVTVALVGSGGSGKSTLACVLGHRLSREFRGRILWVRIGAWDRTTVLQMMAMQLGVRASSEPTAAIRKALSIDRSFIVLDNHEVDATTAAVLDALRGLPVTWVLTARRCLLGGVTIFPVVAPLVFRQKSPFKAVANLTRILRWHAVALDLADALVTSGSTSEVDLERRLRARGVERVVPLEHEDDVPEVRAVVEEALRYVSPIQRRMLGALAYMRGDDMDRSSLATLAITGVSAKGADRAIDSLRELRLVQEPARGRYTLHATVRYALSRTLKFDENLIHEHYLGLFERAPERLSSERTHVFALMDWAQEKRELTTILRVQTLVEKLGG